MITVKVSSAAFLGDLKRAAEDASKDGIENAQQSSERIASGAAKRAPRRTGQLAGSIEVVKTKEGGQVRVESDHAIPVEFGTVHMRAEPFLRPAIADEAG